MLLEDIISRLMYIQTPNVKLYSFSDLEKELRKENFLINVNHNIYIIPFYYKSNYIYELYEFELEINDVNASNIHIKNNCIQLKNENSLSLNILLYIESLFSSNEIKKHIIDIFNEYNSQNLYFEYYEI